MREADVGAAVGHVLAVLRDAGRAEHTLRRHQVVLERFAAFLVGRGLEAVNEGVCIEFIANQTGVRLASLRESVKDRDVQAVRRPVVLMADALAGRPVEVDRSVIPLMDHCPSRFGPLRDDYIASCRGRGNAEATLAAKDKAVSRFLGYGRGRRSRSRGAQRARGVGLPSSPGSTATQDGCGHEVVRS